MKPSRIRWLALLTATFAGAAISCSLVLLYLNDFQTLMAFNRPEDGYESAFVGGLAATFPESGDSNIYLLLVNLALAVTFTPMGAVIAFRQTGNSLGWIFCSIGLLVGILGLTDQYTLYATVTTGDALPGAAWSAWVASWIWMPVMNLTFAWIPLLFPDGRPPTRRWWAVIWLNVVGLVSLVAYLMFLPGSMTDGSPAIPNPLGVSGVDGLLELCLGVGAMLGWVTVILSAAALVLRLRRSRGTERQQIKWFAYAAAMASTFLLAGTLVRGVFGQDVLGTILEFVIIPFLPLAIAAAILRYRLYDIDRIINRTILYGSLSVLLLSVYFLLVAASEYLLRLTTGGESRIAIVISTLAIAALFNPVRRWIQKLIDLRFYRRRYDARATLDEFSMRLRDEVELENLTRDLAGVVRKTFRPEHISISLISSASERARNGEHPATPKNFSKTSKTSKNHETFSP